MGKLWLQICLISAYDLPIPLLFKLQWFAVGWIDPADKYCTRIDTSGATNPVWKTRFSTCVDVSRTGIHDLALQVEVYSREPVFLRERLHGTATVHLKELLGRCKGEHGISSPIEESGTFEIRTGSGKTRGFVDISVRISAEREESIQGPRREVEAQSEDSGTIRTTGRTMGNLSQDSGRIQPRKIILTPRQAAETHSEDPGRNQPQKFIQVRQQRVETQSEDLGCDQPRKIVLTRRHAIETPSEDSRRNQPQKYIQTPQQAVEALHDDPGCLTPRQAVKTLSEDPSRDQPRKIILTHRPAVETPSEERRSDQPPKIVPIPRQVAKTLSENPGSSQFQRIDLTRRQGPNTRSWNEETGSKHPAGQEIHDSSEQFYQPPLRNRTPPPPLPPSNIGYVPGFVPRSDKLPEFSSEALAAAAVIFGDDFLSGFNSPVNYHSIKFHEEKFP